MERHRTGHLSGHARRFEAESRNPELSKTLSAKILLQSLSLSRIDMQPNGCIYCRQWTQCSRRSPIQAAGNCSMSCTRAMAKRWASYASTSTWRARPWPSISRSSRQLIWLRPCGAGVRSCTTWIRRRCTRSTSAGSANTSAGASGRWAI